MTAIRKYEAMGRPSEPTRVHKPCLTAKIFPWIMLELLFIPSSADFWPSHLIIYGVLMTRLVIKYGITIFNTGFNIVYLT